MGVTQGATPMTSAEQRKIGQELYRQWAALWNGELFIAHRIIADGFVAHLSADALVPDEPVCDARTVALWVAQIRARSSQLRYRVEVGPLVDGPYITAYWRVSGILKNPPGLSFDKVGMDILRFRGGRLSECWTMNNTAAPRAAVVIERHKLEFA
jgi:hypothetical protein